MNAQGNERTNERTSQMNEMSLLPLPLSLLRLRLSTAEGLTQPSDVQKIQHHVTS